MHGLAEFAMRSRIHAAAICLIAAAIAPLAWLSTIIVALVFLRQGTAAGSMLVLWVLLPMGTWVYLSGNPSVALTLVSTATLAWVLRKSFSWEMVFIAMLVLSVLSTAIVDLFWPSMIEGLISVYMEYLVEVDANLRVNAEDARTAFLGFFALGQAFAMVILLIVARWCQSGLYNQGGFRKEFHSLRLSPAFSAVILALMMICFLLIEVLGRWLLVLTVPLLFAALGLMHWFMAERKLTTGWVVALYASLVLLPQFVYPLLASVALMDSWFNIRNRIQTIEKD